MNARRVLGILIVLLPMPTAAMGDGGYIPEVAYPANPTIPTQRALITYRDGRETLVVESSYVTDSPNVGWIVPLPAQPTKLDKADAALLTSLSTCLRPTVTHDLYEQVRDLAIIASFVALFAAAVIFGNRHSAGVYVFLALAILMLYAVLIPTLGTAGGKGGSLSMSGITELQSQRVGNYDVTVLSASSAKAVSDWLAANSLKGLDARAKGIIDDYVGRKWCFLVARLHKEGGGLATPHPIVAEFPTASIVYPMKLTSIAAGTTRVELFVAADSQASAAGFECVAADRFNLLSPRSYRSVTWVSNEYQWQPAYGSENTGLVIGYPDATGFLWPGCVVTRLVADLKPDQMASDVAIQPRQLAPYRGHRYSPQGRWQIVAIAALVGAMAMMLVAAVMFRGRRIPLRGDRRLLLGLGVVLGLVCGGIYVFTPVVPVHAGGSRWAQYDLTTVASQAGFLVAKGILDANTPDEKIAELPDLLVREHAMTERGTINPVTGEKMKMECSPGNYFVRHFDGQKFLCFYDENCSELRVSLFWPAKANQPGR